MSTKAVALDTFVDEVCRRAGLFLEELGPGRTVVIETQNSVYQITVLDPKSGKVIIQGGQYFPVPEEAYLSGSTWGGSMIKLRWIGLQMCLEIRRSNGQVLTTSWTKSISLAGVQASDEVH